MAGYPGQYGNALIQKKNLDKFVHTLRNKPVVINHKDNIGDDDKVGEVFNVWYNPEDGWYWCDGIITDKTAQNLIEDKKWSVSCSYDFTKYDDKGGTENNIPYDIEFLDGEFSHLAIVDNPRYEGANIVFNSKTDVNNDKWITIKPNGEENTGRHMLIKDGETVQEALQRTYGIDGAKGQQKLFDVSKDRKTKEDFKREAAEKQAKYDEIGKKREESLKKDGGDNFEEETKTTKKDENRYQKVRDLEDKAYKEFKTMYDNYIDKDGIEGWGGIPASRFDKAKEQFNKKYKDAFDKLESDRFVSFEDFVKRENKQTDTKDGGEDSYYEPDMEETYTKAYEDSIAKDFEDFMKSRKEDKKEQTKELNKANNNKEQDMALIEELKKLITKVENEKGDNMINNEKEDKRKLIDEVGGILKGKVDDEIIRTIIKKMEEASYNESEAGSADNKKVKNEADEEDKKEDKKDDKEVENKKVKNEDEEDKKEVKEVKEDVKEDVDNKCKNSKDDYFERMNKIYNSAVKPDKSETEYVSRADRLKAGEDYFKV